MSVKIAVQYTVAKTLKATIQRVSDGFFRRRVEEDWQSNPTFASRTFNLTEGAGEYVGSYTSDTIANLSNAGDPGRVRIYIHDASDVGNPNKVVHIIDGYIKGNALVILDDNLTSRASPAQVNEEIMAVLNGGDLLMAELSAVPPKNPTPAQALMLLYMAMRNGVFSNATLVRFYNDAGSVVFEAPITPGEETTTRSKLQNVV